MFQSVFALGIVLATTFYAFVSLVRFVFPGKKAGKKGCSGGNCNCSGNKQKKGLKRSRTIKTIELH